MNLCGIIFVISLFTRKVVYCSPDCFEPDTRIIGRWKNGNYYKGVVESLTNVLSVLFDNGDRLNYDLHDKYGILEDRIPDETEIKWGDPVVVHRPHSYAYKPAHIREIVGGRYMVWYNDGSYIYQTKGDIRVFNKSSVCNEPAYLGCYRDRVPRYLTVFIPTKPATVGACVDTCNAQGYSIAALRNSDLCFCGNAYNKGYQTDNKKCDMPCFDNPFEKCGGVGTFSQYWTGIVGDRPAHIPSGLLAQTALHMDPYGFRPSYTTARAKIPVSLAESSPWRWNAAMSSWVRADGKQFRWKKNRLLEYGMGTRRSQNAIVKNPWKWNGKTWVQALKTTIKPPVTIRRRFNNGMHALPVNYHYKTRQSYFKSPIPRVQDPRQQRAWHTQTKPNRTVIKYTSAQLSRTFTPQLVLQKLADRMSHVKWSQLSNFRDAFKVIPPAPANFRYLGCFADDYQRDLPYLVPVFPLTTRSCILKCRANRYSVAGIQRSSQCFCGNSYSKYGRVREEQCNMKCIASPRDTCGGVLRNSLYFTGVGSAWPAKPVGTKKPSPVFYGPKLQKQTPYQEMTIKVPGKLASVTYSKVPTPKFKLKLSSSKHSASTRNGKSKNGKTKSKKKTKTRNKITSLPSKYKHSEMDDFQVESIKVKLNFSELKKALQAMSPEIVRRVQHDLERINKLEKTKTLNHKKHKVKVEPIESGGEGGKSNGGKSHQTNYRKEMEKIRKKIGKVEINRLSDKKMKEILKIMKIPESTWKVQSKVIHRKNDLPKHSSKSGSFPKDDDEKLAHEEIESYSKISFDFPWRTKTVASNFHNSAKESVKTQKDAATKNDTSKPLLKTKVNMTKNDNSKIKLVKLKGETEKSAKAKHILKPIPKFIKSPKKQLKPDKEGAVAKTLINVKVKSIEPKLANVLPKQSHTNTQFKETAKTKDENEDDIHKPANFEDAIDSPSALVAITTNDVITRKQQDKKEENMVHHNKVGISVQNVQNTRENNKEKSTKDGSTKVKKELDAKTAQAKKETLESNTRKENEETRNKEKSTKSDKTANVKDKDKPKAPVDTNDVIENIDENVKGATDRKVNNETTKEKSNTTNNVHNDKEEDRSQYQGLPIRSNDTETKRRKIENKFISFRVGVNVKKENTSKSEKLSSSNGKETKRGKSKMSSIDDQIALIPEIPVDIKTQKPDVALENSDTVSDNGVIYLGDGPSDLEQNSELDATLTQPEGERASGSGLYSTDVNSEQKLMTFQKEPHNSLVVKNGKSQAESDAGNSRQTVTSRMPLTKNSESFTRKENRSDDKVVSQGKSQAEANGNSGQTVKSGMPLTKNPESFTRKESKSDDKVVSQGKSQAEENSGQTVNSGMPLTKNSESFARKENKSEVKAVHGNKLYLEEHASQNKETPKKAKLSEKISGGFESSFDISSETSNDADGIPQRKTSSPKSDKNKSATDRKEIYSGEDNNGDKRPTPQFTYEDRFSGSGAAQVFSGAVGNYVYFGKGKNKEQLPMIRQDDLDKLLEQRELENAMKRSKALNPLNVTGSFKQNKSGHSERDPRKSSGTTVLKSNGGNNKVYARSIIPAASVYKKIRIPISSLSKSKAKDFVKRLPNKMTKSAKYTKTKKSAETKPKPSKLIDIKYYHDVKGIRVHKNGITFTINKKHKTKDSSVKSSENIMNSHQKVSKKSNVKKIVEHHISERKIQRHKRATSKSSKDTKREALESENGDSDEPRKFKDDGSRNELIWKNHI